MSLLPAQLNCLSNSDYTSLEQVNDLIFASFRKVPQLGAMLGPVAKAAVWGTLITPVVNNTGSDIAAGKCVALAGYDVGTGALEITLASPTGAGQVLGVTHEPIADGASGNLRTGGRWLLTGVDTSGASVGDGVLLGSSGALSLTPPSSGATILLGLVASVGSSGSVVIVPPALLPALIASAAADAQTAADDAQTDATSALTDLSKILSGQLTVPNGATSATVAVGAAFNDKPVIVSFGAAPTAAAKCYGVVAAGNLTVYIDVDNTADLDLNYIIDGR